MDDYIDEALKKRGYDAFRIHKMREKYSDAVLRKEFDIAKPKNVKDSEDIEKMILEATKKPPGNESYSDKQKRMNKRDKLRRAAMETQNPSWEKRKALMKKVFETMKAKHTSKQSSGSLTETKAMPPKSIDKPKEKSWENMAAEERKKHELSHDLVKDAKEYRNKHMDELRTIQSNLSIDQRTRRNGFGNDSGTHLVLKPLVDIVMKFIQNKGYTIDDTEAILTTIGFDVESRNIKLIKEALTNKQANKQATPPTPTSKPKLNLFNIQQSNPPVSIPPSMTIKPRASLSISSPQMSESKAQDNPNLKRSKFRHIGRDNKIDYSFGVVKGVESDNRIYNGELKPYYKALKRLQDADMLNQLKSKTGIHSTNRVRSAVSSLIPGRLTGWR